MKLSIVFVALLFAIFSRPCNSESGTIKIVLVNQEIDNSTWFQQTIDRISLFVAKNHTKASQIYKKPNTSEACEFIGGVDRAKGRGDFLLIVRKENESEINCDVEWGRQSFAIMKFWRHNSSHPLPNKTLIEGDVHFKAKLVFASLEKDQEDWKNITCGSTLLAFLIPHFLTPQSRIPDDYPFKAEKEQRMKQRTMKAICALMALALIALLVIMFMGSLSRYNETKKKRLEEEQRMKKKQEQGNAPPATEAKNSSKESGEKSEKSEKPTKKEEKSQKSSKKDGEDDGASIKKKDSESKKEI